MALIMPRGLKRDGPGQKLWKTVTAEFDLENEPHKSEILKQASRVADKIAELECASEKSP